MSGTESAVIVPCAGCRPGWSNNVASLFPPLFTETTITFRYRCGTCKREWSDVQGVDEWLADFMKPRFFRGRTPIQDNITFTRRR